MIRDLKKKTRADRPHRPKEMWANRCHFLVKTLAPHLRQTQTPSDAIIALPVQQKRSRCEDYHVVGIFVSVPLLLHRAQHHQRAVILEAQLPHVKRDSLLENIVSLSFRATVVGTPPIRNLYQQGRKRWQEERSLTTPSHGMNRDSASILGFPGSANVRTYVRV